MAITYISESHATPGYATTSTVVTAPANIQNGDILVAFGASYSDEADISLPSGFTTIATQHDAIDSHCRVIGWKRASSESGNYTFSVSPRGATGAGIIVLRGCLASGSPVDVYSNTDYTTKNTTLRAASVTTTVANTMLVAAGMHDEDTSFTPPSGMTEAYDATGGAYGIAITAAYATQASSGASGNKDFTAGTSSSKKHAFLVAFKPDSAGNPWYAYAQQ